MFYGFYESLFTEQTISDLSSFLEHDISRVNFEEKFNASPKFKLEKHHKQTVKASLMQVYEFCYEKFPQCRNLWENND